MDGWMDGCNGSAAAYDTTRLLEGVESSHLLEGPLLSDCSGVTVRFAPYYLLYINIRS